MDPTAMPAPTAARVKPVADARVAAAAGRSPQHPFVWLASQSPRRRQLLDQLGVKWQLLLPGPQEDAEALEALRPNELPDAYVRRVTRAKLAAARQRLAQHDPPLQEAPILCADTTVALGRRILGKPADAHEARAMLCSLSGRVHRVLSSVAVSANGRVMQSTSVSRVRFAALPDRVVRAYVASAEPFGKAGGYAIQGALAGWIEHIEGSHSGIVGLPLHETAALLRRARVAMALA